MTIADRPSPLRERVRSTIQAPPGTFGTFDTFGTSGTSGTFGTVFLSGPNRSTAFPVNI
jgi:hypothetical protein